MAPPASRCLASLNRFSSVLVMEFGGTETRALEMSLARDEADMLPI